MSGKNLSEKLSERVEQHAEAVGEFATRRGLPAPTVRSIDQYLDLGRSEISRMSRQDIYLTAIEIENYAYYLQDQVNQVQVKIDKCTHEINKIVVPRLSNYDGFRFDDKVLQATLDDDVTKELNEIRFAAVAYKTRFEWLSQKLGNISRLLKSFSDSKGRQYGEE